jgi:hypothetical protein
VDKFGFLETLPPVCTVAKFLAQLKVEAAKLPA